jgi:hypothetical protein
MRWLHDRSRRVAVLKAWIWVLSMAAISAGIRMEAQPASSLFQAKKLYIDTFSGGSDGGLLRKSLIKRIQKSGKYQVVETSAEADAIVKGGGEIWVRGYLTTNSRSPNNNRQAVYGGFLSVDIVSKDGEPIWSYLVTPSKFA